MSQKCPGFYSSETLCQILYFYMINAARLIPLDVIWRFMSHIVDRKNENYKKLFIVKFHQILRKGAV